MNWLSLDGAFAAMIIGTIALGLGGIGSAFVLGLFFFSSYIIGYALDRTDENKSINQERRDGSQVWANSFWFISLISLGYYFKDDLLYIAAAGSLAVAIADTWATEIGTQVKNVKAYFILNFKRVEVGIDGGVSLPGTLGGLLGSLLLSIVYVLLSGYHSLLVFFVIGISGFLGCVADSYLGAIFQARKVEIRFLRYLALPAGLDNNGVNFVSTGIGALITLCYFWLG